MFGRSTEKTEDIIDNVCSWADATDPVSEDIPADDPSSDEDKEEKSAAKGSTSGKKERKPSGKKKKGKRAEDFSRLPGRTEFQFDVNALNDEYGEGNWSITSSGSLHQGSSFPDRSQPHHLLQRSCTISLSLAFLSTARRRISSAMMFPSHARPWPTGASVLRWTFSARSMIISHSC